MEADEKQGDQDLDSWLSISLIMVIASEKETALRHLMHG